jgi:transposase
MTKKPGTSKKEKVREKVIFSLKMGISHKEISKKLKVHIKSIPRMLRNYRRRRSTARKIGSGRPKKLNSKQKQSVQTFLKKNPTSTAESLLSSLSLPCSPNTVRNYLKSTGFSYKMPRLIPDLTTEHKIQRLNWAKTHKNYDFDRVIFTDECSVWLDIAAGRCWIKRGTDLMLPRPSGKHKLHLWGAISAEGKVSLHIFSGILTADRYIVILRENLLAPAHFLFPGTWVLQQDNDPKHTAKKTKQWLEAHAPAVLPWPSRSPDLNPIENIWGLMKRALKKERYRNLQELENSILDFWGNLSQITVSKCAKSMRKRCSMVIKSKGDILSY